MIVQSQRSVEAPMTAGAATAASYAASAVGAASCTRLCTEDVALVGDGEKLPLDGPCSALFTFRIGAARAAEVFQALA
eukprot:2413564-Pleurochrysis_carterae.AAC.1